MDPKLLDDIISTSVGGGVGGAAAGIVILLVQGSFATWRNCRDSRRVYSWLLKNSDKEKEPFRSTRAIASYNNLTEDRVRFVCSHHDKIKLSTGTNEDLWSIHIRDKRSSYFTGTEVDE
ncbi:hypothetical protein [Pseudomonas pseudonitroreducens]|uniref:hypothetical protein n=1 Tax=Pseudomonas pseudonitroreducens TaxID=2892326 RepID=UPI001F38190C|nr:hypothetical protein [Pseudomonas pseudonitroreducens]